MREDETFLWRIDTQPPSYFFGTIHVPYTRVWDAVSDNAKKAFKVRILLDRTDIIKTLFYFRILIRCILSLT